MNGSSSDGSSTELEPRDREYARKVDADRLPLQLAEVRGAIDDLLQALLELPNGPEDKNSDPKKPKQQRERLQRQADNLKNSIKGLENLMPVLSEEIARCERNMGRIRQAMSALHNPDAQAELAKALEAQEHQRREASRLRDKLNDVIALGKKALKEAAAWIERLKRQESEQEGRKSREGAEASSSTDETLDYLISLGPTQTDA